ncbi:unnamed protein product [Cuscuta europaea]|uniref:Uncharacterized protein n=1 Tax=Cuscuta europaea TaxID=41803 RepID=A0A9P0Z067_CUSEU|nr:unnamed protein product [Cuscuta europaea]
MVISCNPCFIFPISDVGYFDNILILTGICAENSPVNGNISYHKSRVLLLAAEDKHYAKVTKCIALHFPVYLCGFVLRCYNLDRYSVDISEAIFAGEGKEGIDDCDSSRFWLT